MSMINPRAAEDFRSRVRNRLVEAAKTGTLVQHSELMALLEWPDTIYRTACLALILDSINTGELCDESPMLTAVVVNSTGMPAKAFFEFADKHQRVRKADKLDPESKAPYWKLFWKRELERVYEAWA